MPYTTSPIVGTITMEPRLSLETSRLVRGSDDSSLDSLLASLARCASLADDDDAPGMFLVATARLSRFAVADDEVACDSIRADLSRLVEDLEAEYDRLAAA